MSSLCRSIVICILLITVLSGCAISEAEQTEPSMDLAVVYSSFDALKDD
ncbi:hypothetical protein [Paenibacillus sinopodophylli]|nr:hypothetical protein [Paenibacillus sinopodophylli]